VVPGGNSAGCWIHHRLTLSTQYTISYEADLSSSEQLDDPPKNGEIALEMPQTLLLLDF